MQLEPTIVYRTHLAERHRLLLTSRVVRTYLTGTGIRLDGVDLAPADRFELLFGTFSTVEFAHLFSIFDSSRVHQQAEKSPSLDEAPPGLYFTIINPQLIESQHKNRLGMFQPADAAIDLFIENMHIDYYLNELQAPPTLGTLTFPLCAITAHLAGMAASRWWRPMAEAGAPATSARRYGRSSASTHRCCPVKPQTPRTWPAARPCRTCLPWMKRGGRSTARSAGWRST
ncbi:hypothetical protein [Burkholderia sp. LMG 13014]|uniref:hypothetical protein n=1 Tax=Burkholderia sp. LMG 13014 TaxID=2709306 RepID=UPI00196474C3|nr:hypothetical protein [Burkholderia sp. LMG 13014]